MKSHVVAPIARGVVVIVLIVMAFVDGRKAPASVDSAQIVLPNGWTLSAPDGLAVQTGTMPQGAAVSPDGSTLAVVESGFNPPALVLYKIPGLQRVGRIALSGASGRPVWTNRGILVAGANADGIFDINPQAGSVKKFPLPRGTYPTAIAAGDGLVAVSTGGDGSVRIGTLTDLGKVAAMRVGAQPGRLAFSADGTKLFVTVRSARYVAGIDVRSGRVRRIQTDLHPSDVLIRANRLYVAQSDADTIGIYDSNTGRRLDDIFVGSPSHVVGSSPNALAAQGDSIFVSLGAANTIAVLRDGRVAVRLPTGWYPTDVVPVRGRLYVIDGKGEGTKPNPDFDLLGPSSSANSYIAAIQYGSVRELALHGGRATGASTGPSANREAPAQTILRENGPIKHAFFILKENRSYDQVLGDMPEGNGDPKLVWFGARVTPNQHALTRRFGLFDNCYASGEVSDSGHNWADAAFANDYVERTWPMAYGGRLDDDAVLSGKGAPVPSGGYMWDAARRAGVPFRDYGEMANLPAVAGHIAGTAPSLGNRFDPRYVSWNLDYSDLDRVKEWKREFDHFIATDTVPRLEYVWLPNDHTYGSRAGKLTPAAYVATNDYAVGMIVSTISHSKIWGSSVVFISEDDAQDGADHVSDQRTTLYVASPYARGGVFHDHFSTLSVLKTIELLLGIKPLSTYDATALPLYAAFSPVRDVRPFDVSPPQIDLTARNSKVAYGEIESERADFTRPDAVPQGLLTDILMHNRSIR